MSFIRSCRSISAIQILFYFSVIVWQKGNVNSFSTVICCVLTLIANSRAHICSRIIIIMEYMLYRKKSRQKKKPHTHVIVVRLRRCSRFNLYRGPVNDHIFFIPVSRFFLYLFCCCCCHAFFCRRRARHQTMYINDMKKISRLNLVDIGNRQSWCSLLHCVNYTKQWER